MNMKKKCTAGLIGLTMMVAPAVQATSWMECVKTDMVNFDGSIVDAAIATPELSTLVDLVVAADLVDALATTENITVFAPTNDAFAAIPGSILSVVGSDLDILTAILTYHVSPGNQDPRRWTKATTRTTLNGQDIFLRRTDGHTFVNESAVNCTGVQADNGVVWFVDGVLMPQFVSSD